MIMLFTGKTFFLGSRNDLTVTYQCRCAVMIKCRNT